jgi:hypothetical protein
MSFVYVIIENGKPYPIAYKSFECASTVVKEKHKDTYMEQIREADGGSICTELDVPENILTNKTYLYIEKEIHIYIHKLPIL